jgi:hypothetical protein
MCKHFVTKIPDIPMTPTPMDDLLVGTFPDGFDCFHVSSQDGRSLIYPRDFETSDVLDASSLGIAFMPNSDSLKISYTHPKWMDGSDFLGFANFKPKHLLV